MPARRTVARTTTLSGVGLHTGAPATLRLGPAPVGAGIVFHRTDVASAPALPASLATARAGARRTTLARDTASVETVEHLLAAVAALGLDDLTLELDGPEVPILDGSAEPFLRALEAAEPVDAAGMARTVALAEPVEVHAGDAAYRAVPADRLVLHVTVEWAHPLIGRQTGRYEISATGFTRELAAARTFGFLRDAAALAASGLARGASTTSVIVLSDTGLIDTELRWPDEFVRHKAVDLLGDLALLGGRLGAEVTAVRPSHRGNLALAHAIDHSASRKEQTP